MGNRHVRQNAGTDRAKLSSYLVRHTPLAAGGLVFGAVLVGVLYYAQAGLLTRPATGSYSQTISEADISHHNVASQAKDKILDTQGVVDTAKSPEQPVTTQPRKAPVSVACDEQAKQAAKLKYDAAMRTESRRHQKILSEISQVSKILNTLTLGSLSDDTRNEGLRHDKAIASITKDYQEALVDANC